MKRLIYLFLFVLLIDLSFQKCANPGRPTGGPKDTIPPTLIYANPSLGTTNFNESEIELEFSEFINADKIKQQLIITPKSDIQYKSIVKRNKLIIKLEDDLADSTTYNFSFADAVTDITEKNPVVNLSLAFSTGDYIDSLSLRGYVEELMEGLPGKGYLVGLYPLSDTLDYFSQNPLYFSTTNDSGTFKMNYLKEGDYKILAFFDDNRNLLLDPETESHGFLEDTVSLYSNLELETIRSLLQNVKPLKLINSRPIGPYVESKFNKMIDTYTIHPTNLNHNIIGENRDVIRIYKPEFVDYSDSLTLYLTASDSLNNTVTDTLKFAFLESNRKPASFSYTINRNILPLEDTFKLKLDFNKPITQTNFIGVSIQADSLVTYTPSFDTAWNPNKTSLNLFGTYSVTILDSMILNSLPDSVKLDSLGNPHDNIQRSLPLDLVFPKGTFISVEQDSSLSKTLSIQERKTSQGGKLLIRTITDFESYTLQLLNEKGKVAYQSSEKSEIIFNNISPGKYLIRILIDNNQDGRWSYGNLLANKEPEEIFIYAEETSIRENWVIELDIAF